MIISVSSIKNWFLKDKLCDILNYSYNHCSFEKDIKKTNIFCSMGNDYESKIVKEIIDFCKKYNYTYKEVNRWCPIDETTDAINQNIDIIFQPHFFTNISSDIDINGFPDILIRKQFLLILYQNHFFKNIDNDHLQTLLSNYNDNDYIVIDIKYSVIKYDKNFNIIINSKYIEYIYAQIVLYTQMYNLIYNRQNIVSFIFNKSRELVVLDTKNEVITDKIKRALQWQLFVFYNYKNITDKIDLYKAINDNKTLLPNVCNLYDSPWKNAKQEIANKLKDVGLIFGIGDELRSILQTKNIYSYENPNFLQECKKLIKIDYDITYKLVKNLHQDVNIKSKYNISYELEPNNVLNIYLDIETLNINDKNYICLIGMGYIKDGKWNYICYLNDTLETTINIDKFKFELNELSKQYKTRIIYYSGEENKLLDGVQYFENLDLYKMVKLSLLNTDKLNCLRLLNLKLKTIVQELQQIEFIKEIMYKNLVIKNGLDAMELMYNHYVQSKKNINLKDLIEYNEIDCKSLFYLYNFLFNN